MKTFFNQKIIPGLLIFSIVFSIFITLPPKRADAIISFDPSNFIQNTLSAISSGATAVSSYSVQFKEYVLDGLASIIAKQIIRQITSSIVSWINSGFQGSPSFLQNPGSFFLDVADQITGDFLAKAGGPLTQLCSPFSIDIRLALAFKYRPNVPKRFTCTLGKIIGNTKNAVAGASINGFTAGDFKQGGWPAFVSLTTEPQNNIYGAYLQADSELSWRVANAQQQKKEEISNGNGFLSWRDPKCKKAVNEYNASIDTSKNNENTAIGNYNARSANADEDTAINAFNEGNLSQTRQSVNDCPVQTPGSVISGTLQNNLNGPLRELELADEFNEIVNALFAQLATKVLQGGLAAVSSKGSNNSSYLDETVKEFNATANPQVKTIKDQVTKIDTYKKSLTEYKQYIDESLNTVIDIKNNYDSAKTCYQSIVDRGPGTRALGVVEQARAAIAEINSRLLESKITQRAATLATKAVEADNKYKNLQSIQDRINAAVTVNDLSAAVGEYDKLVQVGGPVSINEIQQAKADLETIKAETDDFKNDAQRKLQMCQILN